jgi:hypothetical protein
MDNSFYYFFSAVPQVLGGVLALFGVFVLYKIQALKDEQVMIASDINQLLSETTYSALSEIEKHRMRAVFVISKAVRSKNIIVLKHYFNDVLLKVLDEDQQRKPIVSEFVEKYNERFDLHQNLLKATIVLSSFTAFIIVACLSIIPFGCYMLSHLTLLHWIFGIIMVSIVLSFVGLIIILTISLRSTYQLRKNSKKLS